MAGIPWIVPGAYDDNQPLRKLAASGLPREQIAEELTRHTGRTRTPDAVRVQCNKLRLDTADRRRPFATLTRVVSETPERVVYAPEESASEEAEAVWERAVARTRKRLEKDKTQSVATVRIMTDKPILFSVSSDWHISTTGACDLEGLRAYAEAIANTPGAFAVAVGDLFDNPIKWQRNMEEVPDELTLVGLIFKTFGYKLLGATSGNHDDWTVAFAGIDALRWLAERERIHYAPDELTYLVELVDPKTQQTTARYSVATRHKYYRHSNLNPTHSCFRWLEDRVGQWPETEDGGEIVPDVLAIGHNHVACCEERTFKNKPVWGARMGPWQYTSAHGRAGGWRASPPTAPSFILYPHRERPVEGYADYRSAVDALRMRRAERAA